MPLFMDRHDPGVTAEQVAQAHLADLAIEARYGVQFLAYGLEVKHTGDGIMASFDDVLRALECSIAIQAGFESRAASAPAPELRVRIGIAAGSPSTTTVASKASRSMAVAPSS